MLIVELNTSSESFQTDYKWFSISTLHFKKVSGLDGIQIQLCIHRVPTDWVPTDWVPTEYLLSTYCTYWVPTDWVPTDWVNLCPTFSQFVYFNTNVGILM